MTRIITAPTRSRGVKVAVFTVACLASLVLGMAIGGGFDSTISDGFMTYLALGLSIAACAGVYFGWPLLALSRIQKRVRELEAALRTSEARFQTLTDALPQIVWTVGPKDDRATYLNSKWFEYTGLHTADNEVNTQVIHPDDHVAMGKAWAESRRTGEPFEYEFRMRPGENGPYLWFLARGAAVLNEAKEVIEWIGTSTDIDNLKQTQRELSESNARFRTLTDALPQIVWAMVPFGTSATYLNSRWEQYTGLKSASREANASVVHPDDHPEIAKHFTEAHTTGNPIEYKVRLRPGENGPYLWFLVRGMPVRNEAGEIIEWIGTSTDIDELKQTEEALRESQRQFRELAESIPQLVWTDRPDGYCDYLSPQWVKYTGVPQEKHLGYGWLEAVHPEDRPSIHSDWDNAVASGTLLETEFRIRRADGMYRWFQTRGIPLRNEKGEIVKWFGTNTDIDDLKKAQRELNESEARFHSTFDSMLEGCQIIGKDWRYLYVNSSVCSHGRRTKKDLIGRKMMDVYPGFEQTEVFGLIMRCMMDRTCHRMESIFDYPEGGTAWFNLSIQPVPEGVFILSVDITKQKHAEAELEKRIAERTSQLHDAGAELESFCDTIARELQAIDGSSDRVLQGVNGGIPEESQLQLREVRANAQRIGQRVHDLLAASRSRRPTNGELDLRS